MYFVPKTELLFAFQPGFLTRWVVVWAQWTRDTSGAAARPLLSSMKGQRVFAQESETPRMQLEGAWKVERWRVMMGLVIFCCEPRFAMKIWATYFELPLPCSLWQSLLWGQWLVEVPIIPKCRAIEKFAPSSGWRAFPEGWKKHLCKHLPGPKTMWCWLVCTLAS